MKFCTTCKLTKSFDNFSKDVQTKDKLCIKCKDCLRSYRASIKNEDHLRSYHSSYYQKNKEKKKKQIQNSLKLRILKDPALRLRRNVGRAVIHSLKRLGINKTGSTFKFLPYSPAELRCHLESLWEPWMSWDNYGPAGSKRTWQIDHIIPHSSFRYEIGDDNFLRCWDLSNLRPMESVANIRKSNKCI